MSWLNMLQVKSNFWALEDIPCSNATLPRAEMPRCVISVFTHTAEMNQLSHASQEDRGRKPYDPYTKLPRCPNPMTYPLARFYRRAPGPATPSCTDAHKPDDDRLSIRFWVTKIPRNISHETRRAKVASDALLHTRRADAKAC